MVPVARSGSTTAYHATYAEIGMQGTAVPAADGVGAAGTSMLWSPQDHVHPTDTTRAPLASPAFTGTPTAPTAGVNTNTTQLATTAYVINQASGIVPWMDGTGAAGSATAWSRGDHVHPTDTSRAPLASPTFTGTVTLPTAVGVTPLTADNSTNVATTAFVKSQSYLTGNQTVTLTGDVTGSGATSIAATLANTTVTAGSYTYSAITVDGKGRLTAASSGVAPAAVAITTPVMDGMAAIGTDTTHFAAANHVHPTDTSRYAASNPSGYISGNQTVTLSGDVSGSGATTITATLATVNSNVGTFQGVTVNGKGLVTAATNQSYAPLASPTFSGTPSLPTGTTGVTQTAGNNSTALATTAFVATSFAPLASPALTGTPTVPTAAAGTNTTQAASAAFVATAVAPALNDQGRNLIHNARFNIQQRGTGPWTTGVYTLDRWWNWPGAAGDTMSVSALTLTDADRTAIGDESAQSAVQIVFTGGTGATNNIDFAQNIEGARRTANKTVTVSFWAKASSGTPKIGSGCGQIFGTGGLPSASVFTNIGVTPALTTTWTRYSFSKAIPSVAGKTLGTNRDDSLELDFWLSVPSANTTYYAASGNLGAQSGTVQIWGVQIEIGSVATPLETIDPMRDLQQCQRFYFIGQCVMGGYLGAVGQGLGQTYFFPVSMRAAPTITMGTNSSSANLNAPTSVGMGGGTNFSAVEITANANATGAATLNTLFTASADL